MNARTMPTVANAGRLMDEAARLTPPGWDFAITWTDRDVVSGRAEWVAGWYPTHRAGLSGDTLLDATRVARGETAADALAALLDRAGGLPR